MTGPRAPIYAFLRPHLKPPGWNDAALREGMDRHLDLLGVPRAEEAVPPPAPAKKGLADPEAFWNQVRPIFGGSVSPSQKDGIDAILAAAAAAAFPTAWTAYALATAMHETGASMYPNRESLNYSVEGLLGTFGRHRISAADAQRLARSGSRPADQVAIGNTVYGGEWGRENLGNTEPGDGYFYRGGGMDHCTGRANFAKVDAALGLGGTLVKNPDLILQPGIAARTLVSGLETGRYRGIKIADKLPRNRLASPAEFVSARPIINPDKNGALVAGHALKFQRALVAGGWA